ncbi:N-formyl peptide receptor 2-like [Megalops cyprinoides]|uniref:N-formyl peptide receptor 2-like n=1 Tax=Megalops cyprinoides TaxID=118141 RepID=UPI00186454AA|nr:N-formyl peptide receptor 2-like [Megalops cyprinoides]
MQCVNASSSNATSLTASRIAPSVVLGLFFVVGIPSNIVAIVMIARHMSTDRGNFTLKLMLNLALSDTLGLITLPAWIYNMLKGWDLSRGACQFVGYMIGLSLFASVLTVTLMSVQRYLTVLYTQCWARLRGTGERVLLVALWGLAGVIASPAIPLRDKVSRYGQLQCRWNYRADGETLAVLFMETLLGFVVPFSILVTSYFCLHKKVNQTAFFSSQRMTKLVTSIVVTFFIFWSPVHIVILLQISTIFLKHSLPETSAKLWALTEVGWDYASSLMFINSCVNPFLYVFTSRKLRQDAQQERAV